MGHLKETPLQLWVGMRVDEYALVKDFLTKNDRRDHALTLDEKLVQI